MNETTRLVNTAVAQICRKLGPDAYNFDAYEGHHVAHFSAAHPNLYLEASALAIDGDVSVRFHDLQVPLDLALTICQTINQYVLSSANATAKSPPASGLCAPPVAS